MSDYNTSTQISVRNNFSETVSITLTHQYSDDEVYTQTWNGVAPGAVTTPWKVEYNTGFGRTGKDHWNITVTSGANTWQNATKDKQCTLKSEDADTVLVFGVSSSSFDLNMNSPSCDDAMTFNGYNRCTQISVLSNFPDAVTITLTHQYAGDPATTQTWQGVTDGQTTSPWWVGYNTGAFSGFDRWDVTVTDGISVWKNATEDKRCFLKDEDAYTVLTFDVSVETFHMTMKSSSCSDDMTLVSTTQKRPVWSISHMCNAPEYLTQSLEVGANGVECDVQCTVEGSGFAFEVHHGFAGPGYPIGKEDARTPLPAYLQAMVEASQAYPGYTFQYFDCKIPDGLTDDVLTAMGSALVSAIEAEIYPAASPVPLYCVINCADVSKVAFLSFAANTGTGYAAQHLGVMVDQKGTPSQVLDAFQAGGIDAQSWYSHGTNILQVSLSLTELREAVELREQGGFSKVAMWTVNAASSIATLMGIQIDAILSDTEYAGENGVQQFLDYIASSNTVRLATRDDNPFAKVGSTAALAAGSLPQVSREGR